MERNNLFEVIEEGIPSGRVRKVGDGSRARPRNNGGEEDAYENCTAHTIHHQDNGKNANNFNDYYEYVNLSMEDRQNAPSSEDT